MDPGGAPEGRAVNWTQVNHMGTITEERTTKRGNQDKMCKRKSQFTNKLKTIREHFKIRPN